MSRQEELITWSAPKPLQPGMVVRVGEGYMGVGVYTEYMVIVGSGEAGSRWGLVCTGYMVIVGSREAGNRV